MNAFEGACRTCACVPQQGNPYCRTCLNSLPGAENAQTWRADEDRLTEIDAVVRHRLAKLDEGAGKTREELHRLADGHPDLSTWKIVLSNGATVRPR